MKEVLSILSFLGVVCGVTLAQSNAEVSLQITLHMYSGKPDPQWTIPDTDAAYQQVLTLLSPHAATPLENRFGYRGFLVELLRGGTVTSSMTIGKCTLPAVETDLLNIVQKKVPDGDNAPLKSSTLQYVTKQMNSC